MATAKLKFITTMVAYGSLGMLLALVSYSTELMVFSRATIGAATILVIMALTRHRASFATIKSHALVLVGSSLCLALNWLFLFAAYRLTTVAIASVLNYLAPILLVIAAPFLFHERVTWRKAVCVAIAFGGVTLVAGVFGEASPEASPLGTILAIAAALCFAGIVTFNRHLGDLDPLDKTACQLGLASLWLLPFTFMPILGASDDAAGLGNPYLEFVVLVAIGVVFTGLVYVWYFDAICTLPVQTVAVLGYLEPVVSVITSALVLGEPLSASGLIGSAMVIGAALLGETWAKPPAEVIAASDAAERTAEELTAEELGE